MIPERRARLALLVPLLAGLALGSCGPGQPPASASETGIELFVNPRKSLYVEPALPLGELLERYAQRMGWSLLASDATREKLGARHCDLMQKIEVPFGSVHAFVESLVRANGLYLRFEQRSDPVVLQVVDPDDKQQGDAPGNRVLVPLAEVPRWEAHPAHMITTQAPLPAGDPALLVSSLRAVFGEAARGVVQQAGDTNTILFSGSGAEVARLVRVLDEISRPAPAGATAKPVERTPWIELLRTPEKGLHLEDPSPKGLPLEALVAQYAQLMGWQLLVDPDVRAQAQALRFQARMPLDVPPENVHAFVEGVLRANDFMLEFPHAQAPVLLRLTVAEGRGERLRSNAMEVACDELPRWVGHTDFLIRTKFNLPGVDVRALSNVLRLVFSDNQRQQILPIGTDGLLVTGYASEVARISMLFRALVDEAAGVKSAPPPAIPSSGVAELLVAPAKALHLDKPEQGELRLSDFVQQYAQLMGWRVLVAPDTRNQLLTLKCGFALPVDVPPEQVHSFVEGVLQANDFVLGFAHAKDPVLLEVTSTNVAGRGNARSTAQLVSAADLPRWAAHPAFLVTTVLDLPGIDVRTLSNSLRQMFSDQQTQQIIPMGNSDSLLVTGFGSDVAALSKLFHALSAAAAGVHEPLPPVVAGPPILELLAPPRQGLHLEESAQGGLTLAELVDAYAQRMGWRVLAGPDTRNQLRVMKCSIALPVDVAPENVHGFVEGVLRANDFVLGFAHAEEPILLEVGSVSARGNAAPRQDASSVPAADLPRWAAHTDFLITTCLDLPGVDVRTLSNSLRQMFSDQQTQQIIPVGNSDGLIVTGFASDVAAIATTFRGLVDAAAGLHGVLPASLSTDSGIGLFVPPAQGLHFEKPAKEELRLAEVFEQYAQRMGWRILAGSEDWTELRRLRCSFTLPLDVPPENAHAFVEGLAREHGLVLGFAHGREPVLLRVASTSRPSRSSPMRDVAFVAPAELARWAAHPAFLIRTCVDLPGIDVRTLSNSLRQMFSDAQTQQVIPAGNSDGLLVTGFGPDVANLVSTLAELARGGAGLKPASTPAPPAADRERLFPLGGTSFTIAAPSGKEAAPIDVLEEFASWTKRPLEISDEARKALEALERHFAEPRIVPAQLAYPCVGLLLERAHCRLSPLPPSAPAKWVVDVVRGSREVAAADLPSVPFEELGAWSSYCATPFRTFLKLPDDADSKQVDSVLKIVAPGALGCRVDLAGNRALQLCGTPLEVQATASAILQACAPAAPR